MLFPDGLPEQQSGERMQELATALQTSAYELALRAVEESCAACEDLSRQLEPSAFRLRGFTQELGEEVGANAGGLDEDVAAELWSGPGLLSGLLFHTGLGFDARAATGAASGAAGRGVVGAYAATPPGLSGGSGERVTAGRADSGRVDICAALAELRGSPGQVWRAGARLQAEVEMLEKRLASIRACWPNLQQEARASAAAGEPLELAGLAWTLREAVGWRTATACALAAWLELEPELEDAVEQHRAARAERRRWRSMSEDLLGEVGQAGQAVAVRAAAAARRRGSTLGLRAGAGAGPGSAGLGGGPGGGAGGGLGGAPEAAEVKRRAPLRDALRRRGGASGQAPAGATPVFSAAAPPGALARRRDEEAVPRRAAATKLGTGMDLGWFDLAALMPWGSLQGALGRPAGRQEAGPMGVLLAAARPTGGQWPRLHPGKKESILAASTSACAFPAATGAPTQLVPGAQKVRLVGPGGAK